MFLLELIVVALWIASTVCAALLCKYIVYEWNEYKEYEVRDSGTKSPSHCFSLPLKRVEQTNALILSRWLFRAQLAFETCQVATVFDI